MQLLQSLFGLAILLGIAWLFSERRKSINWRVIAVGLVLQFLLALLLIKVPLLNEFVLGLNQLVLIIDRATTAGTSFLFGYLGGADLPFESTDPGKTFILAFKALPLVVVVSALSALLFHWRILPWLVRQFSRFLQRTMGLGGALGLGAAANVFVGMIEAPLFVRPYLNRLSRSELFALMSTGMATIAGTMMVLYASILSGIRPDALGHILTASVISVPAALVIALVMVPGGGDTQAHEFAANSEAAGAMDAVTRGTLDGVKLLINIIAMLLVFVALVALINLGLATLPHVGGEAVTLQRVFGFAFAPLVWLMGIPASEVLTAGSLMGTKTILNEFLAYLNLSMLPAQALSERSQIIMIYALCGFANFGSLGIMLGGIGTMVPERRAEVAQLGMKSIVAGTLATMMTGTMVGLLY